jgi:hypothetical protein
LSNASVVFRGALAEFSRLATLLLLGHQPNGPRLLDFFSNDAGRSEVVVARRDMVGAAHGEL